MRSFVDSEVGCRVCVKSLFSFAGVGLGYSKGVHAFRLLRS